MNRHRLHPKVRLIVFLSNLIAILRIFFLIAFSLKTEDSEWKPFGEANSELNNDENSNWKPLECLQVQEDDHEDFDDYVAVSGTTTNHDETRDDDIQGFPDQVGTF